MVKHTVSGQPTPLSSSCEAFSRLDVSRSDKQDHRSAFRISPEKTSRKKRMSTMSKCAAECHSMDPRPGRKNESKFTQSLRHKLCAPTEVSCTATPTTSSVNNTTLYGPPGEFLPSQKMFPQEPACAPTEASCTTSSSASSVKNTTLYVALTEFSPSQKMFPQEPAFSPAEASCTTSSSASSVKNDVLHAPTAESSPSQKLLSSESVLSCCSYVYQVMRMPLRLAAVAVRSCTKCAIR